MGQDWRHKEFILSVHDKDCIRAFDFWAMSIFSLHSWLHIVVEWIYARWGGNVYADRMEMWTRNLAQLVSSLTEIWFPLSHALRLLNRRENEIHVQTSA